MGKVSKSAKAAPGKSNNRAVKSSSASSAKVNEYSIEDHLPPLGLVFTIIACSGFLFVFSFRDAFATGKSIVGGHDTATQLFTKSIDFFDDSRGWKSRQGGLSAIELMTTDANNMGGLFVRKIGGAAGVVVQLQKLVPFLFHPVAARWKMGHFRPLLYSAIFANIVLLAFYVSYMEDLKVAGADVMAKAMFAVLLVESLVMAVFLYTSRNVQRGPAQAMKEGKTPSSVVSRIVARTVLVVSGAIAVFAARDLFYPGVIFNHVPYDDIYLEWTGAFFHSPPEGSPEEKENEIVAALYIGDKFVSQLMGLNFLILCMYKAVSALVVRVGADGSGDVKARMFWRTQCLGNFLILFIFRLFTAAAKSASWDIRWHVMCIAYEGAILGVYTFF